MNTNRGTLIANPYQVILADGTQVVAWASGKKNKYATLRANVGGTWVTIGEWNWHVLEEYWNGPFPKRPLRT